MSVSAYFVVTGTDVGSLVSIYGLCCLKPDGKPLFECKLQVEIVTASCAIRNGVSESIKHIVFVEVDTIVISVGVKHL